MKISGRSVLMVGAATLTASAVAISSSVQPPPPPRPEQKIQLVADVQLTAQPADYFTQLAEWWQPIFWPSANRPLPSPPTQPLPTPTSIASSLEGAYHAIEPWVRYGFELATYAVGWIPWVGWLSGQIMIFYNFGERIVHAIAHNTLDWLNGNGSFLQNLGEGISWTIDAFIQLGIDEWNFFLPPLPPLPPLPFSAQAESFLNGVRDGLRDPVIGLLQQLSDGLSSHDPDQPPPPPIVTATAVSGLTTKDPGPLAAVSSVPTAIFDALNPAAAADSTVVAKGPAVPPGPKDPKQLLTSVLDVPGNLVKVTVDAQGKAKGAAAETADSLSTVGRGPARDSASDAALTVKKRVTDTADGVASTVKKATGDTHSSVKKGDDTGSSGKKGKSGDK